MEPAADTSPTPGEDLRQALAGGRSLIGRQLTRGETHVVDSWMSLSCEAQALYGRLFARRDRLIREADLGDRYPEVPSPQATLTELDTHGFVWRSATQVLPVSWLLPLYDRPELVGFCRQLSIPHTGRRTELDTRLQHAAETARPLLTRAGVRLRAWVGRQAGAPRREHR